MKKVRMKCITKTNSKLAFVKLIKEYSELGLKEAKDLVDSLDYGPDVTIEFDAQDTTSINQFRKDMIDKVGGQYSITGGIEFDREFKLLTLGLGTEEDYVDFISENLTSFGNINDLVRVILGKLSKEDLMELTNKIEYR